MESMIQMAWPFILMAAIFYMMIYRPQKRDQKKRVDMLNALKVGTRIVTIGAFSALSPRCRKTNCALKWQKTWNSISAVLLWALC